MTRIQRIASTVSIVASVLVGVGGVAMASPDAGPAQAAHVEHGHHRGHHGGADLVRASLRLESLSASQRQQIEGLVAQERAAHANVRAARGQLMQALANGIDAGNVDANAIAPNVQAVAGAIQSDEPGDRAALEKLHAILTPAQRAELVDRIESHARRGGSDHEKNGKARRPEARGEMRGGPLGDLGLTDAQREQIHANLKASRPTVDKQVWQEARDTHKRVLEAFKSDRFVMNEVAPPKDPRLVEQGVDRMVNMAKAAAPVLTPPQRAIASAKLRAMAARQAK